MKKLYLLLITTLLTITLSVTTVKASNGDEIIPFHPDPSLVTEWDVDELGYNIYDRTFNTPILKVIMSEEGDYTLEIDTLRSNALGKSILWIFVPDNVFINLVIRYFDAYISEIWLGGTQSIIPTINISNLTIADGNDEIENIYIYPDVYINMTSLDINNDVNLYSYNFEYELNQEYHLGYNDGYDDGWSEKNKMTDLTILIIGLIIFIIANILGFIYKINLLTALSGLLWLLPIFLVDNIFIKIFSVIIMLITFLFSFKERNDYYV